MNCDYTERYVQIKQNKNDSILSLNVNYVGVLVSSKYNICFVITLTPKPHGISTGPFS